MACALPVVATRIGGVVDVVRDGENGILVAPGDEQGLAEGILRLLTDRDAARRLGANAHRTISESYTLGATVERYTELYGSLLP